MEPPETTAGMLYPKMRIMSFYYWNNKVVMGALLGNTMEFFDFIIYVYLFPYISQNFFPTENVFLSQLLTFSVFAGGYLTRPFGAMIFGFIGDRYGRRMALIQSITFITIATACMGILPTYAQAGIVAPLLLTLCRLVQGLAVSGEEGGAAVYLSELFGRHRDGFIGGLVLGSSYVGVLLGSFSCYLMSLFLLEQQMLDFGWRILFLFSIPVGLLSLKYRLNCIESKEFDVLKKSKKLSPQPVKELFQQERVYVVSMLLLVLALAIPIYMYTIYVPSYLSSVHGFSFQESLLFSSISLFCISFLVPFIGNYSDHVGHERMLLAGFFLSFMWGYLAFMMFSIGEYVWTIVGQCLIGISASMIAAPMFAVLIKNIPTGVRYTGVSFVFNTSMALFGSTVPIVSVLLLEWTQCNIAPGFYLSLSGAFGLLILFLREVYVVRTFYPINR